MKRLVDGEKREDLDTFDQTIRPQSLEEYVGQDELKENIKKLGITQLHVFPYSIRKGTRAASMKQVNEMKRKGMKIVGNSTPA